MKIDRLLGITIYLLNHGKTSAQVLAERFEVSKRTIIRDMDVLSLAGIPIVASYGAEGGYEVLEGFNMEGQFANSRDYSYIVTALQGLASAYTNQEIEATIEKVNRLAKDTEHTVIMDFSVVRENRETNETLFLLNKWIQKKQIIAFHYTNARDEEKGVEVEPVATIYKWYNWYLIGYSAKHKDYRMYKLLRMKQLRLREEKNTKLHPLKEVQLKLSQQVDQRKKITVKLHCKARLRSKCSEYLNGKVVKEYDDGEFDYEFTVPEEETFWYGLLLSFKEEAKVIEPKELIDRIRKDCTNIMAVYQE